MQNNVALKPARDWLQSDVALPALTSTSKKKAREDVPSRATDLRVLTSELEFDSEAGIERPLERRIH